MTSKMALDEMIQYAVDRFTPSADGTWPRRFKELAASRQRQRERSVISRAIKQAFVEMYVKVVPTNLGVGPERVADLERRLVERFDLRAAVVIRPSVEGSGALTADEENDAIHKQIGRAAASLISQGGILRDGDRIACSSGRSCYYTAHFLAEGPASKLKNIELVSMSGNLKPRQLAAQPSLFMNADYNTQELARWFNNECSARYVGRHAVPGSNVRILRRTNDAISDEAWKQYIDIAIFGVGILRPGHYFYTIAQSNEDPNLESIREPLTTLKKLCDKYSTKDYCPVADVAHHLVFVKPIDPKRVPRPELQQIQGLIKAVNDRTLTITAEHLSKIKGGILVAGMVQKAVAVQQLLRSLHVRYLCTDVQLATHILDTPAASSDARAHRTARRSQKHR